jgi:ABC-2 type transport system permease protein
VRRILGIAWKETLLLVRDPMFLALQIGGPLLFLWLFGAVFSITARGLPVDVRDLDGGGAARRLISGVEASPYFKPVDEQASLRSAAGVAVVPPGLERDLRRGGPATLQVLIDGSDLGAARAGQAYLEMFERAAAEGDRPRPATVSTAVWFNAEGKDALFFVPGALALLLFSGPILISALALVGEKVAGTWDALRAAPVSTVELAIGTYLPYLVQFLFLAALLFGTSQALFGLPFRGPLWVLALGTAVFIVNGVAIGGAIAAISRGIDGAWALICLFVLLPGFVLSGFIFPLSSMPPAAEWLSRCFPIRFFLQFLRAVLLKGATAAEAAPLLGTLIAFSAVTCALSIALLGRARRPG